MKSIGARVCWIIFAALVIRTAGGVAPAAMPNGVPPIPADATVDQIKQIAGIVRAGKALTPGVWRGNARVAVCLTFDVDNELHIATGDTLPTSLSIGEYGATTGLPRILAILDRQRIPATFFIPAGSAVLHPKMIPDILHAGRHEIGVHGWVHEFVPGLAGPEQEERLLQQSIDYLTNVVGKRPVGYRVTGGFGPETLKLLAKKGFLYDSSMSARDQPYELLSNGTPSGVAEIPGTVAIGDRRYFGLATDGSLPDPAAVFRIFRAEFDAAYEERTLFLLGMHPDISGLRSRAVELEKLIVYMKSKPGVWFATAAEIAEYYKANGKSSN